MRDTQVSAPAFAQIDLPDLRAAATVQGPRSSRDPALANAFQMIGIDLQPDDAVTFGML